MENTTPSPAPAPASLWGRIRAGWQKSRQYWFVRWGTDIAILVLAVFVISTWQTRGHLSGVPAPDFALQTLDGQQVSLSSLHGKPTMVAFWAPWCTVCASESWNVSLTRRIAGDRANVISVATAFDDVREVKAYAEKHKVDYPVLLGGNGTASHYNVEAYPTVYFVDANGTIKRSVVGYTTTFGMLWRLLF